VRPRIKQRFYPINHQIRANRLRVVDPEGQNLGVLELSEALQKAQSYELDLVLIAQQADPPVARIVDFSKFKYEQQKADARSRKNKREGQNSVKQLRVKPTIDEHDLETKIKQAREFINAGSTVKISVPFRGRMITHPEVGHAKLDRVWNGLQDVAIIAKERWMEGKALAMIVKPR